MTGAPAPSHPSAPVSPDAAGWQVICLCAAWCGVCREWDGIFQALAPSFPGMRFEWIDVEDEDDAMGDVEVETFPTLLVAHAGRAVFFGPVQPSSTQVSRLLGQLLADPCAARSAPTEAHALLLRLQPALLPKR
jgi:thioredoxin 1